MKNSSLCIYSLHPRDFFHQQNHSAAFSPLKYYDHSWPIFPHRTVRPAGQADIAPRNLGRNAALPPPVELAALAALAVDGLLAREAAESYVRLRAVELRSGGLVRPAARISAFFAVGACAWALAVIGGLCNTFALGRAVRDAVLVWRAASLNKVLGEAFGESGGVAVWNGLVFATVGCAQLVVFAASGGEISCVANADVTFGTVIILGAKAETVVGVESDPALPFVRATGYTGVVFVAAIMATVRFLAWGCAGRFGTITVARCRWFCGTGFFAADRSAFL